MIAWLRSSPSLSLAPVLAGAPGLRVLDLDAVFDGGEVTIDSCRVLWQGLDLAEAEAIVVERPAFAWPQARVRAVASDVDEREARALALSALHVAAERTLVLDSPSRACLAAAPLIALDRCAAAGLDVHPWRLVARRPEASDRAWLDVAGSDAWCAAREPAPGEPAWSPEPFEGPVLSVLAVGGAVAGAKLFANAGAWRAGSGHERADARELGSAADLALAASRALGLSWLQADVAAERPALLSLTAGPDLVAWDRDLAGRAAEAFGAWLASVHEQQGRSR